MVITIIKVVLMPVPVRGCENCVCDGRLPAPGPAKLCRPLLPPGVLGPAPAGWGPGDGNPANELLG